MDPSTLHQIALWSGGQLMSGDGSITVTRLSKDTRTLQPGDLYLALRGDNFDGNQFVGDAIKKGAAGAIVDRDVNAPQDFPIIRTDCTLEALQRLAAEWRNQLSLRVVSITGSSGKTSTKEFTAAVLGSRLRVNKTDGNLNNHFGLPLTVLSANSSHDAAVWEIGMNHPGEIAPLAGIAKPDVAIITNIGVAHIEFFPETGRDGIAAEKAKLAEAVTPEGAVILANEDPYVEFLVSRSRGRVVRAGLNGGAVSAEILSTSPEGATFQIHAFGETAEARILVPGEHMVRNALLAVAAGIEFGLSLDDCVDGLAAAQLTGGRLRQEIIRGIRVIDDTYNANPDSMEAALRTLAGFGGGRRIAVLGRMGELGAYASTGYERVALAAAANADILIATGPETSGMAEAARTASLKVVHHAEDNTTAAAILRELAAEGDTVLVKGSRAARMELIIDAFAQ